jgi:putative sigma-54 modulation protein
MIEPIDIAGLKLELDEDIKKYIYRKIGRLDRYLSRHARKSVRAEVKLRDVGRKYGNKYECEVILHMPSEAITAKDSTMNMFAAVDIVEAKLKNQLKKYKETHIHTRGGGIIGRLKQRQGEPAETATTREESL